MGVWSTCKQSEILSSIRMDAEYYRPNFIQMENLLSSLHARQLRNYLDFVRCGPFGSTITCDTYLNDGVVVARPFNIDEMAFRYENLAFISDADVKKKGLYLYRGGDIFFSRVGDIRVGYLATHDKYPRVTISPNIIAARIKNGSLQSEFLTVFLNTKYGQQQLERGLKVVAQPTISTSLVSKIKVFVPGKVDEQKITSIFLSSIDNYEKSKTYYTQAQHLLESELGLDKLSFQKPVGYTARFSELEQSRRLDAEHFYPAFQRLATQMPDHIKLVPLGTQLSFCQRGKQPVYSANGLPVINSKHVQNNKIVFEGNRKAAPNPIADLQIRYGDLLMNGTGRGTLGRAAPYLTDRKAIPDNHVTMLRSRTLDPAYLSFYLNSQVGQLQVEMHQRGTSGQLELYPFDIRKFLVWAAPESFQKEIRNLYDRAAESEQKSRELLDQAKIQVEQLIEEAASER